MLVHQDTVSMIVTVTQKKYMKKYSEANTFLEYMSVGNRRLQLRRSLDHK